MISARARTLDSTFPALAKTWSAARLPANLAGKDLLGQEGHRYRHVFRHAYIFVLCRQSAYLDRNRHPQGHDHQWAPTWSLHSPVFLLDGAASPDPAGAFNSELRGLGLVCWA